MQDSQLFTIILDLGYLLLRSGAEINRVEDTMSRMLKATGFTKINVFVITTNMVVTAFKDNVVYNQSRRPYFVDVNFEQVEKINQLSRKICSGDYDLKNLETELTIINEKNNYDENLILFAYIFISAAFAIIFGGNLYDSLIAGFGGMLVRFTLIIGKKFKFQNFILILVASVVIALNALLLSKMTINTHIDKIIISNIMLVVPGLSFTTSIKDMVKGDMLAGTLGMIEAIIKVIAIAIGISLVVLGGKL